MCLMCAMTHYAITAVENNVESYEVFYIYLMGQSQYITI